ncbi:MAG: BatA domain-containing protein, partial [Phycisphaerae bacterium]|nr:BatA domain-containing protein [Phycisphaerae bacterium]
MMLAFSIFGLTFAAPLLLIGLAAGAIPFILHMISRVRAQSQNFPTLRFLKLTMEKTARRRRLQNWLLLLLRSALLAVLAMAVAEPISQAAGGWGGNSGQVTVLLLDNSYSMATRQGADTRFSRAKADAAGLLSGEKKPAMGCLLPACGQVKSLELTTQLELLRKGVAAASINFGKADLEQRFSRAIDLLNKQSNPKKAIYLFSDLQRESFEPLLKAADLAAAKDIHLFILDYGSGPINNVGITDLRIGGPAIADSPVEFAAVVRNSSPAARQVEVVFDIDGSRNPRKVITQLAPAGKEGDKVAVKFGHRFSRAGDAAGTVRLSQPDALLTDNIRRFALKIGPRIRVLVVRGQSPPDAGWWADPATMLATWLDFRSPAERQQTKIPWPLRVDVIDWKEFWQGPGQGGSGAPEALANADVIFFCEVPRFSDAQGRAIEQLVRSGKTAMFFLGPEIQPDVYNRLWHRGGKGLLPAKIGLPVGQLGAEAVSEKVEAFDVTHVYLAGLFPQPGDYLAEPLFVQRYFKLASTPTGTVLLRLGNKDPLVVARDFGKGKVILCTAPASLRWSPSLPNHGVFASMLRRITFQARQNAGGSGEMSVAGKPVVINVPRNTAEPIKNIKITLPQ